MVKTNMLGKIKTTLLFIILIIMANTVYFIEGINIAPPISNGKIGISFFPILISIMLYIAAIYIFIFEIKEKNVLSFNKMKDSKPIAIMFITFVYILIFKPMGYILSSILYIFSFMYIFEIKKDFNKKKLLNIFFSTLIVVFLVYLLYQITFKVRLPVGEAF